MTGSASSANGRQVAGLCEWFPDPECHRLAALCLGRCRGHNGGICLGRCAQRPAAAQIVRAYRARGSLECDSLSIECCAEAGLDACGLRERAA